MRVSLRGLFAITVWGASFAATRVALESLNPFALVALRTTAGAALLLVVVRARATTVLPATRDRPMSTLLGVILAAHLLLQAYGLQHTSAIHTGWIIGFIPVTVALGAHVLRQQRLAPAGWLGLTAGTLGVLLVTIVEPPSFENAHWGDLLQVLSCFTWTTYTLAAAGALRRSGPLRVTTFAMIVAAAITLVVATGTSVWHTVRLGDLLLAVLFLGFVCSGVGYVFWFGAVRDEGPARVGALLYMEPLVTLLVAASLLSEPVQVNALAGGACVLVGVWLVSRSTRRPLPVGE